MNVEDLRRVVTAHRARYPQRIAQVAQYVLDNPDIVAFGTLAAIADGADVAPSTLVRFGQALGLDGFVSVQQLFRDDLLKRLGGGPSATGGRHSQRVRNAIARYRTDLDALDRTVSTKMLGAFLAITVPATTIYIVAKGRAFPVAVTLAHMLNRAGVRAQLATGDTCVETDILAFADPGDALIELDICQSENGAPRGSIRAGRMQKATPLADKVLHRQECLFTIPRGSEIAAIALCRLLTDLIAEERLGAIAPASGGDRSSGHDPITRPQRGKDRGGLATPGLQQVPVGLQ
ncbi:MAG: hypothetical protein ABS76_31990 [Pelagibacterium sp. SCN 64-44]|nr:MAG: hypothetical protein ABS76_31990 [Pelagibacterium sp. SCN 64-44]